MEGLERLREVIAKRYGLLFLFVCCGDENVLKLTVCPKLCGSGVGVGIKRNFLILPSYYLESYIIAIFPVKNRFQQFHVILIFVTAIFL